MCDTVVIVRPGRVLFAKNSDRDANEGQNLEWHETADHAPDATVRCTYIEIPQAPRTNAVLISRPFWMWGAEMGTNEHGLTIGNEAVFTNQPFEKSPGLIGMDLLRLALERAHDAKEGCGLITGLLEAYGQAGGCGLESKSFQYHNSFIVADPREAYVIETAGREWEVERVEGARSISNGLTIPDFAARYSDTIKTNVNGCKLRRARTQALAEPTEGIAGLMSLLRDHGEHRTHPHYAWTNGGLNSPCVHGGGMLANSQTTASWVAELRPTGCDHWVTATAAPCVSLFKPVSVEQPVNYGARAEDRANDSLWWAHEGLHRKVLRNPERARRGFISERDAIERGWLQTPPSSQEAFARHRELIDTWRSGVGGEISDARPPWARRYWQKRNRRAGVAD